MKTSRRYIVDFDSIDWEEIFKDSHTDCRRGYIHAAKRDSDDFTEFKTKYDEKYFPKESFKRGLYYATYKRLIATAITRNL